MCVIDGRRHRIGGMPLGAIPLGKGHGGRSALSGLAGVWRWRQPQRTAGT